MVYLAGRGTVEYLSHSLNIRVKRRRPVMRRSHDKCRVENGVDSMAANCLVQWIAYITIDKVHPRLS